MFIVFLKFAEQKSKANHYMEAHKAWVKKGVDEEVFLIVGSLEPNLGGCIVANSTLRHELEARINQDPFVAENIVTAQITEMTPSIVNQKLDFVMQQRT